MSTVKDALRSWEQTTGEKAGDAKEVELQFFFPPITIMDQSVGTLTKCQKLSLSTNNIEKIQNLQGMKSLTTLSLARNNIKVISGLEPVAGTLEALFLSYNHIVSLKGINVLSNLKTLYMNHNLVRDINEVLRINELPKIEDVSFIGNPVRERMDEEEWKQPGTTIKEALRMWEKAQPAEKAEGGEEGGKAPPQPPGIGGEEEEPPSASGRVAVEAKVIGLQFQWPPIEQMDKTLGTLTKCKKLFLSTNCIERIQGLQGMSSLRVLGLSRNSIKSIQGIEPVADTLEELWLSFNHIVTIKGIQVMNKLRVLYMNHNYIRDWAEIARLGEMPKISDVSFIGNPLQEHCASEQEWRKGVSKRIPHLNRLDGIFGLSSE